MPNKNSHKVKITLEETNSDLNDKIEKLTKQITELTSQFETVRKVTNGTNTSMQLTDISEASFHCEFHECFNLSRAR